MTVQKTYVTVKTFWFIITSMYTNINQMHEVANLCNLLKEEFEDTTEAIRIRISKKNRQHNG